MSTNKDTPDTITLMNPFSKTGALCVITPSQPALPNVTPLLTYYQVLYKIIAKDCEMTKGANPIQARLLEKALRSAYPAADPSGDTSKEPEIAHLIEEDRKSVV
jgi:hypothetical protein